MFILIFDWIARSEIGSVILKKGEITLYYQKTESRSTIFKCIKYGLFSGGTESDTFLFFRYFVMLNPKTNVCQLRNGVLLILFACFNDARQNHTESYITVDQLFNVPGNICGVLCWSLFCYASLCVIFIFVNTLTRKRTMVALLICRPVVTVSVLLHFHTMPCVELQ